MIKFRQKEYTIQSGKYDGPKDMEEVPGALEVVGKTALAGAGVGAGIGFGLNKFFDKDTDAWSGASTGAKVGLGTGVALKLLLNTMHNPMNSIKYQEVDRAIRQQFGILRVNGITVGDTLEKRDKLDEKYSFNDSDVLNYKINITVQNNKFTMYLLGLSNSELNDLNKILDYYCKKYFGMNYTSKSINKDSYTVDIIFTNYQVISNFLGEVSDKLQTKINLLDNKAIVEVKTSNQLVDKTFSVPSIDKFDLMDSLSKNGITALHRLISFPSRAVLSALVMDTIIDSLSRLNKNELSKIQPVVKDDLNNTFLEFAFNDSGLIEGMHYTVSLKGAPLNIYLSKGTLIITVLSNCPEQRKMDTIYNQMSKKFYNKCSINNGQAFSYTYGVRSKDELKLFLKKIVGQGIKPNIYVP